ncbi:But2 family protein But2 [Schizosaccharomyces cryophilus OY26]|uniref:But2 family protein But2 n=1 Tax=Schizosaccharomyces cryophilus (strain OY26 / ATCC MYA-4695 / CBS 11777 / NBRC 106824 / NRRL Y48691) TaxID=653667 RepID=S9VT45_SCHCR|nr:But2 family protein But2 [Schizosaccharomyces cryophilus OY26]EPY49314.1 But2 family protein But2 [Schizosaccharomyces cryophilus OY26]
MQLLNSFFGLVASATLLVSSGSAAPSNTLYRKSSKASHSNDVNNGVGVNHTFGVLGFREKSGYDYTVWHVSPTSGKTYLRPWDDAVDPAVFMIDEESFLRLASDSNKYAYIGANRDLQFTNHTDYKKKQHDDGSHRVDLTQRKPANNFAATQQCGKLDPFGYVLKRSGKGFMHCGTQVFTGAGRSIDCEDIDSVAFNLSDYRSQYTGLSNTSISSEQYYSNRSADIPPKSERLQPHGIYNYNYKAPDKRMQRFTIPQVSSANGQNQSVLQTFDVPYGRSLYYYTKCALDIRLTNEFFPLNVSSSNGPAEFVVYNMSGNPKKQTTSNKGPTRLSEVARFQCSNYGCEYSTNIACPRAGHSHTYEIAAANPDTSMSWVHTISPRLGMTMFVYSNANYD